ncbi:MAG: DEAD/DEAH box helicase [bacterium]|nr:DEAD/DEAH box helicase [bacterium]
MITFEEIGITSDVLKGITELGFQHPMPIQEKVIPVLLEQEQMEDLIGLAQTGTGKTAAFGLPIIQLADPKNKHTQALILAPTRELCLQITGDLKNFAKYIPALQVVAVYGGADISRQIRALKKGAQVIVATPGRMNDLLNKRKSIDLSALQTVVLDEADEMLNMGFKEELDAILDQTPSEKTTLLFSATMPKEVLEISRNYMHKPREISVGQRNAGAENIKHLFYTVRSRDRYLALKRIVDFHPNIYGIVFCRTRQETKDVAEKLIQDGYNADALHGDLSQAQREYIMQKFRIKNLQLLVATDVAARGLDVKDISHVINYNLPDEDAIYTHRSGRTGRAGQKGVSIAIVNLREKHKIKHIESKLKKKFELRQVPGGKEICEEQLLNLVDKMEKIEFDHKEIDKFLPTVYEKLEWLSREELIKHFVSLEFNRFLDYYRDAKDLNAPEEEARRRKRGQKGGQAQRGDRGDRGDRGGPRTAEEGFSRFYINLGYKDSLTPRDLIGLINRCSRKKSIDIGRIDLMKTFSFFEVRKKFTSDILSAFQNVEYNRREVKVQVSQDDQAPGYEESGKKGPRGRRSDAGPPKTRKKKKVRY